MSRQLILCCDGTANNLTGRAHDTNVARLMELLAPDSQNQLLYYDPGVGGAGELPGASPWDRVQQKIQRLYSLAYGKGIYENIAEAYIFLMRNWQPQDQIFLYGFSRGAFTARSVGGLVTQFGILRPEMQAMVPTLLHLYFLDRHRCGPGYIDIVKQINQLLANDAGRTAPVWFVGVWDTVASVGAPFFSREITALPTIIGKRIAHVRQALSLDEHRYAFRPRPYFIDKDHAYAAGQQSICQQWFSGAHRDTGGGMAASQAGLSQQALLWMLQESVQQQLRLRPEVSAGAQPLDPAKVLAYLAQLPTQPTTQAARQQVSDELYSNPWWALGGMSVRDPASPRTLEGPPPATALAPVESPTVAANALHFPAHTVWQAPRAWRGLLLAALLMGLLWIAMGALLQPGASAPTQPWYAALPPLQSVGATALARVQFSWWQLAWWAQGQAPAASLGYAPSAAAGAVLLDFAFIVAYAYLLARATSWAFARLAGLRRITDAVPVWLNRLGMSAGITVAADIAENLLTWSVLLTASNRYVPIAEPILGIGMGLAAGAKWLGAAGCAALVLWACVAKAKR